MPVKLLRKAPEPNQRPALRRVERPAPEPELVTESEPEAGEDAIDEALEAEFSDGSPAVSRAPRSLLGRMVDAFRGRPPEPAPSEAPETPSDTTAADVAPSSPAPRAAGRLQRRAATAPADSASAAGAAPAPSPTAAGVARTPAEPEAAASTSSGGPAAPAASARLARSARPSAGTAPAPAPAPAGGAAAPAGVARTPATRDAAPAGRSTRAPRALGRAAAATAPSAAPAAAPARPALTLVPTPHPESPAPAPAPAPRSVSREAVDAFASATGGDVDFGEDGMATVDFTGGGGIPQIPAFSTAPVTVSREVSDTPALGPASFGSPVLARAETTAPPAPSAPTPEAPEGTDPEEIYEKVVERLRRDLIDELEQHGHLLRETL